MANFPLSIQSSDPALLAQAIQVGEDFARRFLQEGVVGILFLGAIPRGYFDTFADIDLLFYQDDGAQIAPPDSYTHIEGFEIHADLHTYSAEMAAPWDMAKRWAFTTHQIFYDPHGLMARMLAEKLVLHPEERRWLMIEGMTQSNWYGDQLPRLWAARGNPASAQHMFNEAITYFLNALYGLNNALVADVKWRYAFAEQLARLPERFPERMREVMRVSEFTPAEASRRTQAFLGLWREVLPWVESEVGLSYDEFSKLV